MVLLEGIVLYILVCYTLFFIAPPVILNIVWYRRVKSGKSKRFGPLGIVTIIVTLAGLLSLPHLFSVVGGYFGWV